MMIERMSFGKRAFDRIKIHTDGDIDIAIKA